MKILTQLSVFLINEPGRLATLTHALAKEKLNIVALTLMDSTEHGVLRLVVEEPERARKSLERLGFQVSSTEVVSVEMPNRPGALATLAEKLADAHINIDYAYVTSGAAGGKTTCIFKVPFLQKAMEVLEKSQPKAKSAGAELRSPSWKR